MTLAIIILAAGQGTRMRSAKPKVLQQLAGKSILSHVIGTAEKLPYKLLSIVHQPQHQDLFKAECAKYCNNNSNLYWVEQSEQLGTGHAVKVAIKSLKQNLDDNKIDQVLILYGDVPLVSINDLSKLIDNTTAKQLGLLTLNAVNPFGLGRIIRDKQTNDILSIVEEKDADDQEKLIQEVNTGIFLLPYPIIEQWLDNLKPTNIQKEYYLTDIVTQAVVNNIIINSVTVVDQDSYRGINTLYQLSQAERHYQFLQALALLEQGVNIIDPKRIDIRGNLLCGSDVKIDINCVFEAEVNIGNNCIIEPNCILRNVKLGQHVHIKANSIIEDSVINNNCIIGPFARIRPNTVLEENVHIGNFVEIKKANINCGTKINHLSYIGDSLIGKNVNIGAGTITCNYDGVSKHQTIIGDNAFIGSNTALIAPIVVGAGSTIGAGSTLSKDAPDNKLTIARGKQTTVDNWHRK
ncbi:MAG: bifunctional UDP-N-acetylglucosamine diphosphorylase/glucosamine-1-phosphate N-acetyltransferase GlmU [Gammaproteobacteria bacterium]|nr:bifunctional UDP-N-acetylglucosamine diphosphorylase/glucosamine-1-phosphate N-acetyltransferase GlmU [Gammaproteobacteria bacterium]